jgi:hypothetical protein
VTSQWSIRTRLTLWYSVVLLAGLVLLSAGIWVTVSHSLRASLDDSLTEHAAGVITVLRTESESENSNHLSEELNEYATATPGGNLMEIRDAQGHPILQSKTVAMPVSGSAPAFAEQTSNSVRYRTFTTTVRGERATVSCPGGYADGCHRSHFAPGALAVAMVGAGGASIGVAGGNLDQPARARARG